MPDHINYQSPFSGRYSSLEMRLLFSDQHKIHTWRRLWIALARAEKKLGLPITSKQIKEMEKACDSIDWETAADIEKEIKHDVMAHIKAYGRQAPGAAKIIHLGATSCYVTDNADIIIMREALKFISVELVNAIDRLAKFAKWGHGIPCLAYTHGQPAQPTTWSKRACMWIQDFLMDLKAIEALDIKFPGVKGATGTQASFYDLLDNKKDVLKLERLVAAEMGFSRQEDILPISGQTYTRKIDYQILSILSGIAQSASKFATDVRFLSSKGELVEPWDDEQVGSSAMPHKRNPMHCERICSLSRYLIGQPANLAHTAATQWLERSLDDSAIRRIAIAESFLAADAILRLVNNVCWNGKYGLAEHGTATANLEKNLPYLIMEPIMMAATKAGADRQEAHEKLRIYSKEARDACRDEREALDLIATRVDADPTFKIKDVKHFMNSKRMTGLADDQAKEFIDSHVVPALEAYRKRLGKTWEVRI